MATINTLNPSLFLCYWLSRIPNSNILWEKECMKIYVESKKLEKEANKTWFSIIIYSLKGFFLSSTFYPTINFLPFSIWHLYKYSSLVCFSYKYPFIQLHVAPILITWTIANTMKTCVASTQKFIIPTTL